MAQRPIDEKIVVMKLDNSDFKRKISDTLNTFGSVDSEINKKMASMGDLSAFNRIASGVSSIQSRFSVTGIAMMTTIASVTNSAINMGKRLTSALIDPLVEGGKNRALNIEQAKFQFAGLGMDVEATMKSALDAVRGTAYGLDAAAVVASQFGATGMRAGEQMTASLRGIAGVAAMTGSSYEDIGSVFTTVAGNGRLMGSELLRLSSRGVNAAAVLAKELNTTEANVRSMVSKGKISFEMFSNAMNNAFGAHATKANETYAGSLSNLRAALSRIGAAIYAPSFENKRDIFNELTPKIDDMAKAITPLIDLWNKLNRISTDNLIKFIASIDINKFVELGGTANLVDAFTNVINTAGTVLKAFTTAYKNVFPPTTANTFVAITELIKGLSEKLVLGGETAAKISKVFQGVFAMFSSGFIIAKQLGSALLNLVPEGVGGRLLDLLVKMADLSIRFNESIKSGNKLTDTIQVLGKILGSIGEWVSNALSSMTNFTGSIRSTFGATIDWLRDKLAPIGKYLKEAFSGFGAEEVLGGGTLVAIFLLVKKLMDTFDNFSGIFGKVKKSIGGIGGLFDKLGGAIESFQSQVKYSNLMKIAISIGILAVSLKLLESMDSETITTGLVALGASLGMMMAGLSIIDKFSITGGLKASANLIALSIAVAIMAGALKKLSDIDPESMKTGIMGLAAMVGTLALAMIAMSKLGGKVQAGSLQLIALSTAVVILASAIKTMSSIDSGDLWRSVGAMSVILASLAGFLLLVNKTKFGPGSALGLLAVAGAVSIMVGAIDKISGLRTEDLVKGLGAIAIILAEIAIFSKVASGPNLLASSVALLIMAGAINALMGPIQTFANMSIEELVKGLGGMAIALGAMAAAGILMNGGLAGAAGILIMAAAMNAIVGPVERFAAMTWGEMLKGFAGLAGGMALMAGAAILLTPAIPSMLGFGASLLLMGIAVSAIGVGIALLGMGLLALATLTATSVAAIVGALGLLIAGLAKLIPAIVEVIVVLGESLIDGIMRLVPKAAEAIVVLIIALLTTIDNHLPRFLEVGISIIVKILEGIGEYVPVLLSTAVDVIVQLVQGLAAAVRDHGPDLVAAIMELLGEIIILVVDAGLQVIDALLGWMPGVKKVTSEIGKGAEKYIRDNFGAKKVGQDKGTEFAQGFVSKTEEAKTSGKKISQSAKDGMASIETFSIGQDLGSQLANGINSKQNTVKTSANNLASTVTKTMTGNLEVRSPSKKTDKIGQHAGQGFANGISKKSKETKKSAKSLAADAQKAFSEKMEDAKYKFDMEKIDSAGYIKELEKIKKAYSKVPANVRKVEAEIKSVRDKAAKEKEEAFKKQMDAEKKAIEDRKYYNISSLTQELDAWQKVLNKYKKGTEERAAADREVYRIKNEINRKLLDLNDEYMAKIDELNKKEIEGIKSLNQEYEDAVKSKSDAIASSFGLFEKIDEMVTVSGEELLENLKGQNRVIDDWLSTLWALQNRKVDTNLLDALREMGPKSAAEVKAIQQMTSEQLTEYVKEFQRKNQMAKNAATIELEGMKKETAQKIKELQKETASQLSEYQKEWVKAVKEIRTGTKEGFVGLNADMSKVGGDVIKGLMSGLSKMEGPLMIQAKGIADGVAKEIRKALQVKSPSRVMMAIGGFVGEGLGLGIKNSIGYVINNSKKMALAAKDTMYGLLEGIGSDIPDNELHFRAVIDYDGVDDSKFGILSPQVAIPDLSFANGMINSAKALFSQNDNNTRSNNERDRSDMTDPNDNRPRQPLIVQSILNGRVVAEETIDDITEMLGSQTNLDYSMRGF